MKTILGQSMTNDKEITVYAHFVFSTTDFTVAEAEQVVKNFPQPEIAPAAPAPSSGGLHLSADQRRVNKMMGVSDRVFAKYADRVK